MLVSGPIFMFIFVLRLHTTLPLPSVLLIALSQNALGWEWHPFPAWDVKMNSV